MTCRLLWDAGPGEARAGLVENGQLVEFRIVRPRRGGPLVAAGQAFTARVMARTGPNTAQVSLGTGGEALLQPAPNLPEGALLAVTITRAPIPEPGRWKLPMARPAPERTAMGEPGWHPGAEPEVLFLRGHATRLDEIVVPDVHAANAVRAALGSACPPLRTDPQAIADADFDSLADAAVTGEFPIAGGMVSIERTRALAMIDIDGSGDPLALNCAAAREIGRLLRLLDIGGPVGIDFLSLADRQARNALDAELASACAPLGPHKRTAVNGFGFVQIVRPRPGPSVPEILCATTPGRLSNESRAIALLRAAARSRGHGPRRITAPQPVITVLAGWQEELAALRTALGAEIELVADPVSGRYGEVHVSQS